MDTVNAVLSGSSFVGAIGRQRQAHEPASLLGHEVDRLGRGELRGQHEIALVLAVLAVADDDHLAAAEVLERVLDRGEAGAGCGGHLAPPGTSRSTYLASTSTSRLTFVPGPAAPRLVRSRVSGISDTVKLSSAASATVSEMPSTAIEPRATT